MCLAILKSQSRYPTKISFFAFFLSGSSKSEVFAPLLHSFSSIDIVNEDPSEKEREQIDGILSDWVQEQVFRLFMREKYYHVSDILEFF